MTTTVDEFESHRAHLLAVGYRLTGVFADAEDAVQDAWLRWESLGADRARILDARAWLTTVVSRLCLDRLRSAAYRRETYVGQWLPEPVVTGFGDDPLARVVAAEDARFAAMVVLERLSRTSGSPSSCTTASVCRSPTSPKSSARQRLPRVSWHRVRAAQ